MHCGKIFMPCRKSCITSQYSYIKNIMHHKNIFMHHQRSCIAKDYTSQKNHAFQHKIHASRKNHALRKRNHALPEKKNVHLKKNIYTSISAASFIWQEWMPRESSKTTPGEISTLHQLLLILTSNGEYIEDYIANIRHKLYLLYVKPIELTSNVEEKN